MGPGSLSSACHSTKKIIGKHTWTLLWLDDSLKSGSRQKQNTLAKIDQIHKKIRRNFPLVKWERGWGSIESRLLYAGHSANPKTEPWHKSRRLQKQELTKIYLIFLIRKASHTEIITVVEDDSWNLQNQYYAKDGYWMPSTSQQKKPLFLLQLFQFSLNQTQQTNVIELAM